MSYGVSCKLGVGLGVALLLMSGCAGPETGSSEDMGTARVRIEAARTSDFEITQVTVTAQGGFQADLVRDASGGFVGTLLLPAGFNELVGQAFAGDELVGVSAPVPVQIQAGLVTGATIRILDVTGGQDIGHSPVVLSLSHPLSAITNQSVLLAASAVDPDGDPLSATWSSDCADAVLSSPGGFSTEFSKATAGTCRLDVTISDGALSATETFLIVVFDQNQATGAVNVDGEFVSAPQLFLDINLPGSGFCSVFHDSQDGTCQGSIASPDRSFISSFVNWGNAQPGFVQVTDNCGGLFEVQFNDPFFFQANWLPPTSDTVCLVTARAFSNDGVFSQLSAAVRVRAGTAPVPPQIFASLSHSNGFCELPQGQGQAFCDAPVAGGSLSSFFTSVDWGSQQPGGISVGSSCGGEFLDFFSDPFFVQFTFRAPNFETPCAFFIDAFAQNGNVVSSAIMEFNVAGQASNIQAFVSLDGGQGQCVLGFGQNAVNCPPVFAGGRAFLHTEINWGSAIPGQIQVNDTCGGFFSFLFNDSFFLQADWFPPFFPGGLCTVQVHALSADGQGRTFELSVPMN
ncbi:MAG TPA: hypothetical protein VNM90_03145 [Haliangium sp.]|nr:hypothetical protein [Haliangium sp.]